MVVASLHRACLGADPLDQVAFRRKYRSGNLTAAGGRPISESPCRRPLDRRHILQLGATPHDGSNQLARVATITIRNDTAIAMPPPSRRTSLRRSGFIKSSRRMGLSIVSLLIMAALEAADGCEVSEYRKSSAYVGHSPEARVSANAPAVAARWHRHPRRSRASDRES